MTDTTLIDRARVFAEAKHSAQKRKYTGEPYYNHLHEVATLVQAFGGTDEQIAAAYLHDTVEDQGVKLEDLRAHFGNEVAHLVYWLTDQSKPEDGNRAARKEIDREHTRLASPEAKSVKLADLISNTMSIGRRDPGFAKVYFDEKVKLMEHLADADLPQLWHLALQQLPAHLMPKGNAGLPEVWGRKPKGVSRKV